MRLASFAFLSFVALAGCASSADDSATSGSELAVGSRGIFSCGVDYTRPECLAAPDGCTVALGGKDVPLDDDFPTMSTTFGATSESPYRVDVSVRPFGGAQAIGQSDLTVIDNRTGAELQTVSGQFTLATLGPQSPAMVEAKINVPEFRYQGKPFTQIHMACMAWVPVR